MKSYVFHQIRKILKINRYTVYESMLLFSFIKTVHVFTFFNFVKRNLNQQQICYLQKHPI